MGECPFFLLAVVVLYPLSKHQFKPGGVAFFHDSMQSQGSLKARSSAPSIVLRPQLRRPRCLAAQAAATAVSVATPENKGDDSWNKTYYPKLADTRKVEKDWYAVCMSAASDTRAKRWCLVVVVLHVTSSPGRNSITTTATYLCL